MKSEFFFAIVLFHVFVPGLWSNPIIQYIWSGLCSMVMGYGYMYLYMYVPDIFAIDVEADLPERNVRFLR